MGLKPSKTSIVGIIDRVVMFVITLNNLKPDPKQMIGLLVRLS